MEEYKDIQGYSGRYQISNYGKVWSVLTQKILKPKMDKDGYEEYCLTLDGGKRKYERGHRLVALHYCKKPEGCNIVNHLDCDKRNNYYENLEWTTIQGNTKHGYDVGNVKEAQIKATKAAAVTNTLTITVTKNNEIVGVFYGKLEAAEALGVDPKTIYNCIRENRPSKDGYFFTAEKGVMPNARDKLTA